jgi:ABC-type branched-subunit amino acid transport system ATPase component/branched-subunit amino acid ABC-type transport system permease component
MKVFLQFAILGLGAGAIYGLSALGLVVVYRASRVINFASSAIGMLGTYVYWELHDQHNWPFIAAFVPSVALCAVLGAGTQAVIIRRLENASTLAKLLATLGVLISIEAAVSLKFPQQLQVVGESLPSSRVSLLGISLGEDRLFLFGIGVALACFLGVIYRFTSFGRATSAVAESERGASCLGVSPNHIAAANWAIGSALACTAGVLVAPLTGLSVEGLSLLIIPALAAAVVGDMRSFPITFVAALVIGMAQSVVSRYVSTPGWPDAVPFIVIVLVLSVRGSALPGRGYLGLRLPSVTSTNRHTWSVVVAVALGLLWLLVAPIRWIDGSTITIVYALILLSIVLVTGFAGQISLAQFALAGMGAYVAGRLVASTGVPFEVALLAGAVAAVPVGILVGLPALRARGTNLAIATLALSVAVESVLFDSAAWTGGPNGTQVGIPRFFGLDVDTVSHPRRYAILVLLVFVVVAVAVVNVRRGASGRRLLAVRANERGAASLGVSVVGTKLYAFAVGSVIAALGGILLAFVDQSIVFTNFAAFESVTLIGFAVIGGLGYATGPLYGGTFAPGGIGTTIGSSFGYDIQEYLLLASGLILIVVLLQSPDGMAVRTANQWRYLVAAVSRRTRWQKKGRRVDADEDWRLEALAVSGSGRRVAVPKELRADAVSVRFGGVRALDGVSLIVRPGEVLGLIGPNGAGKTTFVEAATGFVRPESGQVYVGEESVTSLSPRRRAGLGLSRSFQNLELFTDMTVMENLLVASEARRWRSFASDVVRPKARRLSSGAIAAVEQFQLERYLGTKINELSYGRRRLVAIARCLATEPSVLLLDEPAAGLSEVETKELQALLRELALEWGLAVLLIEHDVDLVMRSCDRVVVLDFGKQIAEGTPGEIRANPLVRAAYLGVEEEALEAGPSGELATAHLAHVGRDGSAGSEGRALRAPVSYRRETSGPGSPPSPEGAILSCTALTAGYGGTPVVQGVDLSVGPGEVVAILGPNGAGKTTTLLALSGAIPPLSGSVLWQGARTRDALYRRVRAGMAFVPEERSVFTSLSVADNLRLGRGGVEAPVKLMPQLGPLLRRRAGLLSGGEQQILTLARALTTEPKLLLADELSAGLAPIVAGHLLQTIRGAADSGLAVILVEQHVQKALEIADRAYVMRRGHIVMSGTAAELAGRTADIEASYLSESS